MPELLAVHVLQRSLDTAGAAACAQGQRASWIPFLSLRLSVPLYLQSASSPTVPEADPKTVVPLTPGGVTGWRRSEPGERRKSTRGVVWPREQVTAVGTWARCAPELSHPRGEEPGWFIHQLLFLLLAKGFA